MKKRVMTEKEIVEFKNKLVENERSIATIQKYMRDVRVFATFAKEKLINKELAIEFKSYLSDQYAPASVNSMLAALNSFFKAKGWYDCMVKSLKIQKSGFRDSERELNKEEYYRLLTVAKRRNTRLYFVMQAICATGIRVSELKFITVEALKEKRATISLKGKTRYILLPTMLVKQLLRYARDNNIRRGCVFVTRGGKPLDRSNILHSMKELCEEAKVDRSKVFPHNLRHLFACVYYQMSKDISRLADLLGHSSINTTRIYTTVSGDVQRRQLDRMSLII